MELAWTREQAQAWMQAKARARAPPLPWWHEYAPAQARHDSRENTLAYLVAITDGASHGGTRPCARVAKARTRAWCMAATMGTRT
jgi:hypothetical protein